MMHVVRGLAIVGVAMLAALVAAPQPASAHARYKSSIPGKSEVVAESPGQAGAAGRAPTRLPRTPIVAEIALSGVRGRR